ncbi:hypothetical protein BT93_G2264 [Corymbia citriodora subsp. variegata]|nr:hypothetical protein BT93_G2264 [Corymbia citriodora subsp. variegata]
MRKQINILGHEHALKYHEQKRGDSTYECNGCQQLGFGPCYSCNASCNLHYHPRCSELLNLESPSAAPRDNPPPYPTGDLVLKERVPHKVRRCVACGDEVRMLRYKWRHRKAHDPCNPYWRLYHYLYYRAFHPLCASLPASLPMQMEETGKREIVLQLMERIRGECLICNGNAKGWAYNSTSENYSCHVGCMKKKIIERLQQKEASQKRKVTIYVKRALRQILEIVKVAFQIIIEALFGFPSADLAAIVIELFEFTVA